MIGYLKIVLEMAWMGTGWEDRGYKFVLACVSGENSWPA